MRSLLEALAAEPDPHTAVELPGAAIDAHLADSLVALELAALAEADRIADIGAGAGFPGLPLAIALPGTRVDLIEAARRKSGLIERLIAAAGLANARAVPERAETWAASNGCHAYSAVTARAVGPLAEVVEYASPLLADGGLLVAWKGSRNPAEETAGDAAARRAGLAGAEVRKVSPFEGARDRHLHVFRKTGPTPPGVPRRPGMARKRPLA
jgi:16S rRNA (guanine527-N7)-methyltransferase